MLINGDGETTRDFCYIDNVVQANILAAMAGVNMNKSENLVFNVAFGQQTSLSGLSGLIYDYLRSKDFISKSKVVYENFRAGDIRHSLADIARARNHLGYQPEIPVEIGIKSSVDWYFANHIKNNEQGK